MRCRVLSVTLRLTPGILALLAPHTVAAAPSALEQRFTRTVRPFLTQSCIGCHSGATPAAQLDLRAYTTLDQVMRDPPRWTLVMDKLAAEQMPPSTMRQPPAISRQQVIAWIKEVRSGEARKHAGDPGVVLARRLSNSEYNYTIRDLTGVDMRPTREFPVDPANPEGFDNSGESLTMSPALLGKYLQAAREVSDHLVLTPPDSPVPVEVYPSLAFDSLFENRGSLRNMSILDRVKDRAEALTKSISSTDKTKLDEYLTSVREVEKRVDGMRKTKDQAEDQAKLRNQSIVTMERPANGLPEDLRDHARLMCDLIAIAFQTDRTRVASLLLARDLSAMYYPFLEVKDGHHAASHDNLSDGYERISRFHLSQLAYLATKLDAMKEGDGTVLDNSCLMFLSNMWAGRKHDNRRLPLVMAGGLGGTLQTGRALSYLDAGEDNQKMCSLFLSIMDRMGIQLEQFGDAQERLQRI